MKRLYRSINDAKIAGIFGGIGEEFGADGNIIRLAAVFACVATGIVPLVATYIVAWIILPSGRPQQE